MDTNTLIVEPHALRMFKRRLDHMKQNELYQETIKDLDTFFSADSEKEMFSKKIPIDKCTFTQTSTEFQIFQITFSPQWNTLIYLLSKIDRYTISVSLECPTKEAWGEHIVNRGFLSTDKSFTLDIMKLKTHKDFSVMLNVFLFPNIRTELDVVPFATFESVIPLEEKETQNIFLATKIEIGGAPQVAEEAYLISSDFIPDVESDEKSIIVTTGTAKKTFSAAFDTPRIQLKDFPSEESV